MKNLLRIIIGIVVIAGVIVLFFILINNRTITSEEVKRITAMDLETDYPESPSEVVTLYSRIIKCYYYQQYSDDEFETLVSQAQMLMDDELLEQNPYDEYILNVQADVEDYAETSKVITSYNVEEDDDVEYLTLDEDDNYYAKVDTSYVLKADEGTYETYEQYVLREDSDGNWKILYWTLEDSDSE